MTPGATQSPMAAYEGHLREGRLPYQYSPAARAVVFPPRIACPQTGGALVWRFSSGLGTVHSATVVHGREGPSHNVALVDLDEGFRLMSRVDLPDPRAVRIGMRVRARIERPAEGLPFPVFDPVEAPDA